VNVRGCASQELPQYVPGDAIQAEFKERERLQ